MKKLFYSAVIWSVLLFATATSAEEMRVVFINPGYSDKDNPTGGFWNSVSAFMTAAADDLKVDLEIIYCDRNHIKMRRLAEQVLLRQSPPDYLVVVNEKLSAEPIVVAADKAGVKTFVILNRFEDEQYRKMGPPRSKYKHWIGSLIPDNRFAGYRIAKLVIDRMMQVKSRDPDHGYQIVGFSGDYITQASIERVKGLKQAVAEYPDVELAQVVPCNWSKDEARQKMPEILKRYPEIDAVWGANDPIAIGAIEGAADAGRKPGKDIFFGGLNWDPPGLAKVQSKEMVTSVGGHFMTGGWALVLLYDYHHGNDFAEFGTRLRYKIFGALHSGNIDTFLRKFGDRNWDKIDFTTYSMVLNPNLRFYHFEVESIIETDVP